MSDKPTTYLNKDQVYKLNERHGYFRYADAQGDVSRAFANDAVAAYMQMCAEASQVAVRTGLTPLELEENRDALNEQFEQMREALRHCEDLLTRHEINRADHEEIEDNALSIIRAALSAAERKTT